MLLKNYSTLKKVMNIIVHSYITKNSKLWNNFSFFVFKLLCSLLKKKVIPACLSIVFQTFFSGVLPHGLNAIMGPTGSGKTS